MANEVRLFIRAQVDGQDAPGFEDGLRYRTITGQAQALDVTLPAEMAAGDNPGAGAIAVSKVIVLKVTQPTTIYLGANHSEGIPIGVGGGICIWGASGKAGGPDVAVPGEEECQLKGLVAGE